MDKNLLNISKIETFFNTLLDNKVSENTFFTDLPAAIKQEWNDMVVVDFPNTISDLDACGQGKVLVWLYARPKSNGTKNVPLLSKMEIKLNECLASNNDLHYIINRSGEYADYDDQRNLHCNIVELNLIII